MGCIWDDICGWYLCFRSTLHTFVRFTAHLDETVPLSFLARLTCTWVLVVRLQFTIILTKGERNAMSIRRRRTKYNTWFSQLAVGHGEDWEDDYGYATANRSLHISSEVICLKSVIGCFGQDTQGHDVPLGVTEPPTLQVLQSDWGYVCDFCMSLVAVGCECLLLTSTLASNKLDKCIHFCLNWRLKKKVAGHHKVNTVSHILTLFPKFYYLSLKGF